MNNANNTANSTQATKEQLQFINRINRNLADPLSSINHLEAVGWLFGLETKESTESHIWHVGGYKLINSLLFANDNAKAKVYCTHLDEQSYNWLEQLSKENIIGKNVHFYKENESYNDKLPKDMDYINFSGLYGRNILHDNDKLLAEIAKRLSKQGLVVIDYPILPGAIPGSMFAEMFRFHCNPTLEPEKQYGQALALLKFIEEAYEEQEKASQKKQENAYRVLIKETMAQMTNKENDLGRLMLDFIIPSTPKHFVNFLGTMSKHKLKFVTEANLATIGSISLPENTRKKLSEIKNFINLEQYVDFITNKRQRQSILCNFDTKFNADLSKESMAKIGLISLMRPEKNEDLHWYDSDAQEEVKFVSSAGSISLKDHYLLNIIYELMDKRKNNATTPETLIQAIQKNLHILTDSETKVREKILTFCAQMIFSGFFFLVRIGEAKSQPDLNKPLINPLILDLSIRYKTLPNKYYFNIEFDNVMLLIMRHMNGKTSIEELREKVMTYINKGDIVISQSETKDSQGKKEMVESLVTKQVEQLHMLGFLQ